MLARSLATLVLGSALLGACQAPPLVDAFDDRQSQKADALTSDTDASIWADVRVLDAQLFFSQAKTAEYTGTPRYLAYKFYGPAGFKLDLTVRSDRGDAVAWLFDDQKKRIAHNDDVSTSDVSARVTGALRSNAYHYIVFRDFFGDPQSFTVELQGSYAEPNTSCTKNSDCVRVQAVCCAFEPTWAAVNGDSAQLYSDRLDCRGRVCSSFADDGAIAVCNAAKQCEMAPGTPPTPPTEPHPHE